MQKYALLCLIVASFHVQAQPIFRSIEQTKYIHGESLQYVSKSRYFIEITFHVREGFIILKNKDLNYTRKFINVIPTEEAETWRAFSRDSNQTCLFKVITNKFGKCVIMDDNVFVYFIQVSEAILR